jgi:multiple sugar transport system substrate-binding protein
MYDGLALFYNKNLIEAAGVGAPTTWNDLRIAAEKVAKKEEYGGKITIAGVALGSVDNVDHWSDIVGLMLKQGGVNPLNSTDDEKIKSVLVYYSLYRTQYNLWDDTWPASTIAFANGNLGFYFAPSWRTFNLKEINANLAYEIVPVPQLEVEDGTKTNVNWSSYWVEGVNANSKYQKEAFKFLEYLSSVEGLQKMFTLGSQIRDFGPISPRKSMSDSMISNVKIKPFVSAADTGENWYLSSRTFDGGLNDEMIKYFGDAINSIVNENKSATDVVPTLRSGINQLKQRYSL